MSLKAAVLAATLAAETGLAGAATAQALSPDSKLWTASGPVYATAISGRTLYIGGDFSFVGPYTGCGVPLDAGGVAVKGFSKVLGTGVFAGVFAVVPDGSGGWYVGGQFDSVGGVARQNLAHVLGDGTVSDWNPGADGLVWALAMGGGVLYAGGKFANIGGQPRNRIAALDPETGSVSTWNPGADNEVWILVVRGKAVYAGGLFTQIGGAARGYIAALDAATGAATSWNPGADSWVSGLAVDGNTVYAGGAFRNIGGQPRNYIAALDATSGLATSWDPNANFPLFTVAVDGNTVYVGGEFGNWDSRIPPTLTIGGEMRNGIAALDVATGHATPWNPASTGWVRTLAVDGQTVYAGGDFGPIGGQDRSGVAALDKASGQATPWDPGTICFGVPTVWAVSPAGGIVYVGGRFLGLGGRQRSRLAAIDMDTGQATPWNPGANAIVRALAVSANTVYAGGDFRSLGTSEPSIGGQPRNYIAALDAATGLATAWSPEANSFVLTLGAAGSVVYAGGFFTSIGGQARNRIAALDAVTGLATTWDPNPSGLVSVLAPSGSVIYAGGSFTAIGGQPRNRIAALDVVTGLATAWDPNANGGVRALAVSGAVVYAGGVFTAIGGQTRNFIAALSIADGLATPWNPDVSAANPTFGVRSIAAPQPADPGASAGVVYVGGAFGVIGGRARSRLAAIDAVTGLATEWQADADSTVWSVAADSSSLYAGGDFVTMSGETRPHLAGFLIDTPTPALLATFTAVWRAGAIELAWSFAAAGFTFERLERAPAPGGPWAACAAEIRAEGARTLAVDREVAEGRAYWYRLVASRRDGSRDVFGPVAVTAGRVIREFILALPSPNPTAGTVRVEFELPRNSRVRLIVHDVQGREVARLVDGERDAGRHLALWDARGLSHPLAAGLYFLRFETPEGARTQRLVVRP